MARKVFQDFAHVLCQRFVEVPSNRDLVNLFLFGGGTLLLDLMARRATCNRYPIKPLPYAEDARRWIETQMVKREIPVEQLVGASLKVDYQIVAFERTDMPYPSVTFQFACTGTIASPERVYTSELAATKRWGLAES
jgi:hypothetical protein